MRYLLWLCLFYSTVSFAIPLANGDKLYLHLAGEEAFSESFVIDDQGQINLPEVGVIQVSGLELEAAQSKIKHILATVYRNLDEFKVTLQEKKIRIQVLGFVQQPGIYSLKPNSNIQMAITAAGGIRPGAQLDQFKLITEKKSTEFNYKSYLDTGDATLLPSLLNGDTLFIPSSPMLGNIEVDFDATSLRETGDSNEEQGITIFGELRNPGVFSYKKNMTVVDAVMRADGVTRFADVAKIRVITDNKPHNFDLKSYLDSGNDTKLPPLKPGSTIYVPIEVKDIGAGDRTIYIMGEVRSPGAYENDGEAGLIDVLANAGGPTRFADTTQIQILRSDSPKIIVDLVQYSTNPKNYVLPHLQAGDAIFIPEKANVNESSWLKVTGDRAIKIIGSVYKPGRFEWNPSMKFLDVLAHAGGPKESANLANIRIIKEKNTHQRQADNNIQYFDLESFISEGGDFAQLPKLNAGDTIIIDELPQDPTDNKSTWVRQSADDSIYIFGQIGAPGRYAFNDELGFLDILSAADGPTADANLRQIRISHRNGLTAKVTKLDLALYFETGDETLLPRVKAGDVIYLPERKGDWLDKPAERVVRLMGAVKEPGRYSFNTEMSLLDLLAEAGGPNDNAYIERIMIVNSSCCGDETQTFNLRSYITSPNSYPLPLLRPGDTVYVPNEGDSIIEQTRKGLSDVLSVITLVLLGAAL
ncbi:SLBB domain-containing protein [Vibrio sp. Of7-15]|uniref:SLBB domain-containing protein n=1 Tax=Vibrio sp. Of7-15 TaxID=2724879 RepID=UPI001EF2A8A1|nr:SLBB domain-containing protein [Vibrio sp. Of7-15]MCG7499919.1 SLBB domain-containing protein [Vibrio sp. Of7-15]